MRRVFVYAQGNGLGHIRRNRAIAKEILASEPDCSVLVIADCQATPFFPPLRGVDFLKLPSVKKSDNFRWHADMLGMSIEDTINLRSKIIVSAFRAFKPDIVLVDHRPVGVLSELKPMLEMASSGPNRTRLILGLRDILDDPQVNCQAWTDLGVYEYLPYYDSVFIYGCQDIYDAVSAYSLTDHAQKINFCRYVAEKPAPCAPVSAAKELLLLMMGGAGGDAYPLAKSFLYAISILSECARVRGLILTGPTMASSERLSLLEQSTGIPVQIHQSSTDVATLLRQSTAVVTMAGYNSLCETLLLRKKALVVPRRPDQRTHGSPSPATTE